MQLKRTMHATLNRLYKRREQAKSGSSVREPERTPKRVTLALKQLNMQAY